MQTSKYLVVNDRDTLWGLTVNTVGYEEIPSGGDYPTHGHADGYYFETDKGRILNEYQLLYLTEGEGIFSSAHVKDVRLQAGDLFLLFPGEWHTYHPLKETGWKSYWIGYKGKNIDDRVKAGFLSPSKPVYHVGFSAEIVRLYEEAYETAHEETIYYQQMLAGIVNHLVGLMYSLERSMSINQNRAHVDLINKARLLIRQKLEEDLSIQQIAAAMDVSYATFRKLFKEYTDVSPAYYQQDLRLQRAKELLSTTDNSIKEIAYRLCFYSPDYFTTRFKMKTGYTPLEYRGLTKI
jgi:AraC-like DNA-binding protein